MMLILGALFCLSQAQTSPEIVNFDFNSEIAKGMTGGKFNWNIAKTVAFEANEEKHFVLKFTNMEGTTSSDQQAATGDHYRFEAHYYDNKHTYNSALDEPFLVTGDMGGCMSSQDCYSNVNWKCDFEKKDYTLVASNGPVAQEVRIELHVEGSDTEYCEALHELTGFFDNVGRLILIIVIVTLVLCILCAVLVCCGVVTCCCGQKDNNTVVIEQSKF